MATPDPTEAQHHPPSIAYALSEGIVTIEIGADRRKYCVHKELLIHHSAYCRKALQGPWAEARSGVVTLEDVEPAVYLPDSHYDEAWNQITGTQRRDISEIIMVLAQAYSFGDRFLIPSFRITVNQLFVDAISKEWLHPTSVLDLATWTFEHIPADRPLLQLLTNQFCEDWRWDAIDCAEMKDKKAVAKALKALPTAFVVRTMRRCSELSKTAAKRWELKEPCYLEHDTDKEKDAGDKAHMVYCEDDDYGWFE